MRPIDILFPEGAALKAEGRCPLCGQYVSGFRDEISMREFRISGYCQTCQDEVFS